MTALSSPPEPTLNEALARWKKTVEAELNGVAFDKKLVTRTFEGIAVQPLYTRADLAGLTQISRAPGEAPFLRGVRLGGGAQRTWEAAQEIAAHKPADFNQALLAALSQGQDSVVLTPDLATRAGRDADQATDNVGVGGVSLGDLREFAAALKSVDLTAVPLHLSAGADPRPLAALYVAHARASSFSEAGLSGSVTGDPLGQALQTNQIASTLRDDYDALATWTLWASARAPRLRTIGVDVTSLGHSGATATQELAIALAAAAEYLREMQVRDVPVNVVSSRILFRFAIGPQFFTELAKFRAFRPLWTRILTAFGAKPEAAARAGVFATTGRWNKTLLDPHVNMLRVTTEALSAVLGGCDGLHVGAFDEVTGVTTEFSRHVARNVHTLIAEEFGFTLTADPAGGSWYVERLTEEIARAAWTLFQDIEAHGGLAASLKSGYVQDLVAKASSTKQDAVAKRRLALIGTNLFPNLKEKPLTEVAGDRSYAKEQAKAIAQRRPASPVRPASGNDAAVFTAAVEAAAAGATVEQLAQLVRRSTREWTTLKSVTAPRASVKFEGLRRASDSIAVRTGTRPKVFLAKMGPITQHKARADFAAGFFACGGFEMVAKQTFETAETAAQAALASGASVAVLCSTDETYPTLAPAFARAIKAGNPKLAVVLAGLPSDSAVVTEFRTAGFDEFIHIRADLGEVLGKLLTSLGATL